MNGVLYINVWASIIRTFQLPEHTLIQTSSDKRGSTVLSTVKLLLLFVSKETQVSSNVSLLFHALHK